MQKFKNECRGKYKGLYCTKRISFKIWRRIEGELI